MQCSDNLVNQISSLQLSLFLNTFLLLIFGFLSLITLKACQEMSQKWNVIIIHCRRWEKEWSLQQRQCARWKQIYTRCYQPNHKHNTRCGWLQTNVQSQAEQADSKGTRSQAERAENKGFCRHAEWNWSWKDDKHLWEWCPLCRQIYRSPRTS